MDHRSRRLLALAVLTLGTLAPGAATARSPNLVLIVADDLGYSDLGSYGGEIATPELDRLAFAGIRFSHFYATPRCSPTRAALLTGVWPHEAGVGFLNRDWGEPAYRGAIHASVPTLAERLRDAGYATYMVGKWHLTPDLPDPATATVGTEATEPAPAIGEADGDGGAPSSWPLQRGFDAFYGTLGGSGSYFQPPFLYDGNRPASWPPDQDRAEASGTEAYLTDVLADRATGLVGRHFARSPERPFFLYLAFTAPHWPLQAPSREVERYQGRFDAGWDVLRAERFARLLELGMVPPTAALPPRDPRVEAWDATADHAWQARRMEVYAAMVSAMDRAVGRVVAALDDAGALDDTVIVFLSDNGACAEEFRGIYLLTPLFVPVPRRTLDGREVRFGDRPDLPPGPADTFAAYGRGWAHLSNTPWRGYKHRAHEGGISVPFFVHWPARLQGRAGAIVDAPAHAVDVVPTLLEIAQASAPPGAGNDRRRAPPLRGASLLELLDGGTAGPRTFYWEHEGNRAIESGPYKLVSAWPFGWELYDLRTDRSETHDLAAAEPERAADLGRRWEAWAAMVGVETWPLVIPQVRTALTVVAVLLLIASVVRRVMRRSRPPSRPPQPPAPVSGDAPRSPPATVGGGRGAASRPPPPIRPR